MPALFAGVQEDIDFAQNLPIITLEGHPRHNAAKLLKEYPRSKKTIVIDIKKFLKKNHLSVSDSSAEKLGPKGQRAVKFLAKHTAKLVDGLLQE
jgi:hypothetical protein